MASSANIFGRSARFGILVPAALFLIFGSACQFGATAENHDADRKSRNDTALLRSRENIEKFRKGDAQIKVLDGRGKPVRGVNLKIKQISHDFKFGCYLKIDDLAPEKLPAYEKHFARLFNYAVVGAYWDFVENRKGSENWSWFERELALGQKIGARIGTAPVLWGTNEAGTPKWLPRRKDELLAVVKNRVQSTVKKYEAAVEDWEIVNEPLAPKPDVFARSLGGDYVAEAFSLARATAPAERLMINEYGVFGADAAQNYNRDRYFSLLKSLLAHNVPIDVIGIQAHAKGEWFEPADVAEQLDRYAALGKPIQITEFSAQTFDYDDRKTPLRILGNYRNGIWDEEKQAEFYREFYTVAFGNPQVEAIVAWGLDDERAWLPGIGLIDADGNPKPNYKTLDRLINEEWRTNLEINPAGADEIVKFRGFYGVYEIEAAGGGKTGKAKFDLKKDSLNEWTLRF